VRIQRLVILHVNSRSFMSCPFKALLIYRGLHFRFPILGVFPQGGLFCFCIITMEPLPSLTACTCTRSLISIRTSASVPQTSVQHSHELGFIIPPAWNRTRSSDQLFLVYMFFSRSAKTVCTGASLSLQIIFPKPNLSGLLLSQHPPSQYLVISLLGQIPRPRSRIMESYGASAEHFTNMFTFLPLSPLCTSSDEL